MLTRLYYYIKPALPRAFQIFLRRQITTRKSKLCRDVWPIDPGAGTPPDVWSGWPDQKQFALVLQHDVDTLKGHNKCYQLMALEESLGFRSSFNFVPERYEVAQTLLKDLADRGFEVGVHGLKHDGRLFSSRRIFQKRAVRINHYLKEWNATGFTSPSMHHRLDWMHDLKIRHATTTFDTDPFEPQPDGVTTIFPLWVHGHSDQGGFVELPYTLPQDFTLFVILRERGIDIWRYKLDWIADKGGMVLLNTHPDYMHFGGKRLGVEEYPAAYYEQFLNYIKSNYINQYWHVLPGDIARFWAKTVQDGKKHEFSHGIRI